ncbi:MAG: Holliday junction branch migration DNA helicase RuvB [Acidimicrobiia bacterium]|nr:Holliday junction branch migration DNA helicase RuvB [Acidimicrobiia bacterium]NNL28003.1 Holliday junction branch migration DNA helicase RuvB [Acidimicrobiia bacterium]
MREDGLLAGSALEEDQTEASLRPKRMEDFVGQDPLKDRLGIMIEAAKSRSETLDHVLLSGPPGLGKTTMAVILANEMEGQLRLTSGPALERPGDLAGELTNLSEGDVFFIDEVHRLPRQVEEVLYSAMEDFKLDIMVGKGPSARSIRLDLPSFTLIGATTRLGKISSPLRDRFGEVGRLDYYPPEDLGLIVVRSASILGVQIDEAGAAIIASRSRGTPRIANRLLRRVRDFSTVRSDGLITAETARDGLLAFEVDEAGLDEVDRAILEAVIDKFGGGPVGLSTVAIAVGEEPETIEDAYEPFLIQKGLLQRTPRGRVVTAAAYEHMQRIPPARLNHQQTLLD